MLLIFTDLDGTLLNQDDYRYDAALPVIRRLQAQQIPIVPVTSKTRQEVEALCQAIGLHEPFIVENGSGVFVPQPDERFALNQAEPSNGYALLKLGCSYAEAREGLRRVGDKLGEPLAGFGDLSWEELQARTGLQREDVELAKAREFTEPFVTPKTIPPEHVQDAVEAAGFRLVVGDRFSHLIGSGAGKGTATQLLIDAYRAQFAGMPITTVGLGNSPNDRDMLQAVDIPIIVPGRLGPHPGLQGRGWKVAPVPGAQGWAAAVEQLLAEEQA